MTRRTKRPAKVAARKKKDPGARKPSASKAATKRRSAPPQKRKRASKRSPSPHSKKLKLGGLGSRKRKAPPRAQRVSSLHSAPKKGSASQRKRVKLPRSISTSAPSFAQAFAVAGLLRAAQREQTEAAIKRARLLKAANAKKGAAQPDPKRSAAAKLGWKRRRKRQRVEVAGELLKPMIKALRVERLDVFYEQFEEEWHELADEWDIEDRELYSYLMDSPTSEAA